MDYNVFIMIPFVNPFVTPHLSIEQQYNTSLSILFHTILVPSPNTTDIKLSSDGNHIILTWLKTNGTDVTQSDQAAAFTVDKHDFLKAFGQLFENSKKTINLVE
jgi:hypothetical protein